MADNKLLPATGTGTANVTTRTKDRAGTDTPIIALDINPAGSEVLGTGDATNGMDVDVTRIQTVGTIADANNSTTSPLAESATFTGTATDCTGYSAVAVFAASDKYHDVWLDFGVNGTDWDYAAYLGFIDSTHQLDGARRIIAQYARVRIVQADTGGDTYLRAQTLLLTHPSVLEVQGPDVNGGSGVGISLPVVIRSDYGAPLNMAGTDGSLARGLKTDASGELQVDVLTLPNVTIGTLPALVAGTANIGDVDVLTLPSLPAGNNNIGDVDVASLPALVAGTANIGDVDVLTVPADPFGTNADAASATGSISAKLRSIAAVQLPAALAANGGLKVEGVAGGVAIPISAASLPSHAVTNAGTFAVQVDGNALTSLQLIDDTIKADDAGFTVGTDKVSMAGLQAVAHGANPDAADALDAVVALTNRHRIPFVIGGHPNIVTVKHTTITTAVTDAAIITVSTGTKIVVTAFTVTLDNASTVFPTFLMGFGTANTPTTTGVIGAHGGVPAGGGFSRGDGSGIIGIGADNEDLRVTTTGNATGNGLQIVVTYYTIET